MAEENVTICKLCGLLKRRILIGKFDDKNKKWADESGKLWNGKLCPQCQVIRSKENMRKNRSLK